MSTCTRAWYSLFPDVGEVLIISRMKWEIGRVDAAEAEALAGELGLSAVLAGMLIRRGFGDPAAARAFLDPSLRDLPSPFLLPDMEQAVERLVAALGAGEIIAVYGDYDADGLTATALLTGFFESLGARVLTYVPHRLDEGYGLNTEAIESLARAGARVVVTVDCGVTGHEAALRARALGVDLIVTDHHQVPEELPEALAVIDPQRPGSRFPQAELAGVGVAFFLAGGVRQALRERGLLTAAVQPELAPLLGLVAVGTIADVAPLTGVNRILVSCGLGHLAVPDRPGLAALKEMCNITAGSPVSARDVAFLLAPRLNAAGRLDSPLPGLELLLTRDPETARSYAELMERLNRDRRRMQADMVREAVEMVEASGAGPGQAIVLAREGWHRGVLGLAASKLVELYYRPAIMLGLENGRASGSGRSIPGFNIYEALKGCSDLLLRFGGHEQAAGLSLDAALTGELARAFTSQAAARLTEADLTRKLEVEAELTLDDLNNGLAAELSRLAPFGEGNREPVFAVRGLTPLSCGVVGGKHLKMCLGLDGRVLETIGFNLGDRLSGLGPKVAVAVQRHSSTYQGRTTLGWKVLDVKKEKN